MTGWAWTTRGLRLRSRLLMALVFAGILAGLAAGMAAQGWPGLLAVALAFCIAGLMERPWLVSRIGAPGTAAALVQLLAGRAAFALLLYGVGFSLSSLSGWWPVLPFWLPALVVLATAVLSRMIWRPMPPEWDGFLDEATGTLDRMGAEIDAMARRDEGGDDKDRK